ncbi:MAG TPA: DEAD/DEAH box helicase [Polyangiaceae bacterium]|nr:DEAD/DEAH box helicase [Polyangiaceae bacterium]
MPTSSAPAGPEAKGWTRRIERFFGRAVMLRGEEYLWRVRVTIGAGSRVAAKVQGANLYAVTVRKEGSTLRAWCTCPYSNDEFQPCKHLWATLRVAEQRGLLETAPKPESLGLDPDVALTRSARSGGDVAAEDDAPDDEASDGLDFPAPEAPKNPFLALVAGAAPVSWKGVLAASRVRREASLSERPATTDLRYLVLPAELRLASTAVFLVEEESSRTPDGKLAFAPASEEMRQLGRDAHAVEYWLATPRDRYSPPPLAAQPEFEIFPEVIRELCATGRLHTGERRRERGRVAFEASPEPLRWDDGEPWKLELELVAHETRRAKRSSSYRLDGWLARGTERRPLADARVLTQAGLAIFEGVATRFDPAGTFGIAGVLQGADSPLLVGDDELEAFVRDYYLAPSPPALALPDGVSLGEAAVPFSPVLDLRPPEPGSSGVLADVWFDYDSVRSALAAPGDRVLDWPKRRLLQRDLDGERARIRELAELGFRGRALGEKPRGSESGEPVSIAAKKLPGAVRALVARGFRVEAAGKAYRVAGAFKANIKSGIDWFELDASLAFENQIVRLPALLRALRKHERTVVLDDGSLGLLPEEWLARWGVLGDVAGVTNGKLRFSRSELPLLAAIAEHAPELDYDATFERLSSELENGGAHESMDPPPAFVGELRGYQRDGLGWLAWLERTGLGGCLADDMGLGKTVQVLALLAQKRKGTTPSLVVAPRSVLFNWANEAARFAPKLRVHAHWGPERARADSGFAGHDLVLTTYGTLCRDIDKIAEQPFRFVVLDEAQAVKNPGSHTARAVRRLQAEHRLALSGTPIENHLGELFSLFDFLNPGMLGRAKRLRQEVTKSRLLDVSSAGLLSRAVKPFILRRTKSEVARDLPKRSEQTLYVELSPKERETYDELRAYYRASLLKKVETFGPERSAPHVLAALLRMRQAACHVGLIDAKRVHESSAKLEVLFERLEQVLEGGHKALVFSQFTSLLAIVRKALDERGIVYEYLDGKTTNRQARVERFQTDPACRTFLVSLKAGGVGLNLTAADYVFILDPWWNPAVEQQAIDRAHRIGQTKNVVAYRLLARGTVEEKVEELQKRKRDLVRAVLGDEAGFGGKLSREDLELLMS